eukprot:NODE_90_length_21806_cov_0.389137.p13 type:complete len:107 gc:universal NODE_90_length_21806_cov_0.389137:10286-10606(+)
MQLILFLTLSLAMTPPPPIPADLGEGVGPDPGSQGGKSQVENLEDTQAIKGAKPDAIPQLLRSSSGAGEQEQIPEESAEVRLTPIRRVKEPVLLKRPLTRIIHQNK